VAHPQIAVFARLADGGAKPVRKLEGQKTLLSRTMHAIVYDEARDEFSVPVPFPQALLTFRGAADGEEGPIRVIQGPLTQLKAPMRLALDPTHNEMIVPQGDTVLVFPQDGNGNVAPIRVLRGIKAGAGGAAAVDAVRNLLVVAGGGGRSGPRFLIFNRTAQDAEKPLRTIGGPKNGLKGLGGPFAVYAPRGWIVATDDGVGEEMASDQNYMAVWSVEDDGDVPPRWRIGGPKGVFQMPRGVVLDPKHKEVIVSDKRLNAVLTFSMPELF
jgi:DNA-binding beta-propeller fold protein YncE